MKNIFFSLIIIFGSLNSCNTDNQTGLLDPIYGKDFTLSSPSNNVSGKSESQNFIGIIDIIINIHRPKRNCTAGLGICEIRICIPECASQKMDNGSVEIKLKSSALANKGTSLGDFFELELDNVLVPEFDTTFYLDEDMVDNGFLIPKGTYDIDYSIGKFGGYKIPIIKI